MASSTSQSQYVYVIIRLKMSESINGIAGSLFCHYGETDDAFLIGGLIDHDETLTAGVVRHCKRLVGFNPGPGQRFYLAKAINGLVNHEPVKISIFVMDVLYTNLRWRARHHTPRMATLIVNHMNEVETSYEGQPGPLPPVEVPTSLTIQTPYGTEDEFSIYSWDDRVEKSRCFDFGDFLSAREIENNMGTDVGIIPCFWGDIRMRDHDDSNGIWAETIRIMKSKILDEAFQLPDVSGRSGATANLSRFLQKLELCNGENPEILHDHLKQSKLKVKGFGVDPNSNEAVTIVVSSFTGSLGNWAADHADEIFKLDSIDALTAFVRVSFSNEDLEGKNLYSLIKLDQGDKTLHEYTQEFNSSYSYWKDDIAVKVAVYLYIGGLKNGSVRADLMFNWQTGKYATLMELQNDAAKNSLWRSSTIITPRVSGSNAHHGKGKAPMTVPMSKRPQTNGFGQNAFGSHSSFGASTSKGVSNTMKAGGHFKNAKADFKESAKSVTFNKQAKRERNDNGKNYDSWNKAKKRLTTDEFNRRRNTGACMNCGEVGHVFKDCPKPKP